MSSTRWAVAVLTIVAIPAFAQTGSGRPEAANQDRERATMLVSFLHHSTQHESETASLVKARSDSPDVKALADRLLADHQATEQQLMAYADKHGVDLDAVRAQVRSGMDQVAVDRQGKSIGSATGEYAFMAEPTMDRDSARLAMVNYNTSLENLRKLSGVPLSREFVQAVIKDHEMVIDRATKAGARVSDPEVTNLVDKVVPMLKQHMTQAQNLLDKLPKS